MKSKKTIEALKNPVVIEKMDYLEIHWDDLSHEELSNRIQELVDLDCPVTAIAEKLRKAESTVRYKKDKACTKKAIVPEEPYYGNKLAEIMEMDDCPTAKFPAPSVPSRESQVKQALKNFLHDYAGSQSLALHVLDLTKSRCVVMDCLREVPKPVAANASPGSIFAEYPSSGFVTEPAGDIEFLANALRRFLPESECESLLSELEAEYRAPNFRN